MRIQEYRKQKGMTAEMLAKKLGVTQAAVTNWEKGARRPNIDMLVKLTEVFGCTADELLGIDRKKAAEDEKPETRGQEISVRMSEALADARKRQEA